jgi:hypothetical protein
METRGFIGLIWVHPRLLIGGYCVVFLPEHTVTGEQKRQEGKNR